MKKKIINHFHEYLSLNLILSYFVVNHIILVFIGIAYSFYLINSNFINRIIRSIYNKLFINRASFDLNQLKKMGSSDSVNIKSSKGDSKLTLVESIEELGFIPLESRNEDSNAA